MGKYFMKKVFGHERGYSVCFRQHRARSHCSMLHGYALSFHIELSATALDANGWVYDFGKFKEMKLYLERLFDHKLLVAFDDPQGDYIASLAGLDVADVVVLPGGTGCEAFARMVFDEMQELLHLSGEGHRVFVERVEVWEHPGNMAAYAREQL